MKRILGFLAVVVLVTPLFAVEGSYLDGTVVDVQKKVGTRVLYYIVNTPVTRDDPYYEVQVRVRSTLYTARYMPIHEDDSFAADYVPDSKIQARVDKRHLFLKRVGGNDFDLIIVKRAPAEPEKATADGAPAR